jgi:energy-coupling factor transporter ATP-binding protein EcfA2
LAIPRLSDGIEAGFDASSVIKDTMRKKKESSTKRSRKAKAKRKTAANRKAIGKRKTAGAKGKKARKKVPAKGKKKAGVRAKRAGERKRPTKKVAKRRVAVGRKKGVGRKKRRAPREPTGKPLYLLSVDVENVRCFGPAQTLQLSGARAQPYAWTVIFGDNGVGKTTLLQSVCGIASTLQDRKEVPSFIRYNWWPKRRPSKAAVVSADVLLRPREIAPFSVRYAPERGRQSPPPRWDFNRDGTLNYFGYGASRRYGNAADSGRKPLESSGDESLFVEDADLLNAEEWFVQMSHFGPARRQLREARAAKKVRDLIRSILLDVTDIRITSRKGRAGIEFRTQYGWVPMRELSMGYRTLIAWIVDFARRLYVLNPRSSNPLAAPAVVCIDEIDLHLHQRWQRNVMKVLSEVFPKTQFICTAHNRTVSQAAPRDANLVLLRRKGDHVEIHNHAAELLEGVR